MFYRSIYTAGVLSSVLILLAGAMTAPGDPLYNAPSSPKCAAGWRAVLAANPAGEFRAWVFFTDKGFRDEATFRSKKESFERHLDPHALKRRLKVRPRDDVVSFLDLPVEPKYITELKARGAKILAETEWLNGVCIEGTGQTILSFDGLSFVREMKPEVVYHRPNEAVAQRAWEKAGTLSPEALDYGPSDLQLRQVNVTGLHQMGYTGAGVRLAIFDTGFDRWHETLKRVRVFKEWDFMYNDDTTSFDEKQDTTGGETPPYTRIQTQHGTAMLSIIGGYSYGQLIGSAFGADFLLAKTEHNKSSTETDTKVEEHRWVKAMRWADTLGADVVSSSLGYAVFPGDTGQQYTRDSMNGQTAVTSKIASIAADSFGILVVNAIGNVHDGQTWLKAPSDAFNIMSVGGCSLDGSWWSKSCVGPTADGRTKPEVAALGYGTYMANNYPDPTNRYDSLEYRSGTSGATAVIAGLAALLLEAYTDTLNPSRSWRPRQVREALMRTASQAGAPDNKLGWGIPDGVKALNFLSPTKPPMEKDALFDPYPNPYEPAKGSLRFPFYLTKGGDVRIYIYTSSGELVRQIPVGTNLLPGRYDSGSLVPMWDGKNEGRKTVSSGTYLCLLKSGFGHDVKKVLVVR